MKPERLSTTLDRLPYGPETISDSLRVSRKTPEGVKSKELYQDIIRIAWPSFIELLLTQLARTLFVLLRYNSGKWKLIKLQNTN